MLALIIRSVGSIGTVVTCACAILGIANCPLWLWWISLVTIVLAVLAVAFDWWLFLKSRPKSFDPKNPKIAIFMESWLKSGGKAVVFSRDLTWAADGSSRTGQVLTAKAKAGELTLFLESEIPFARTLKSCGAEVYTYPTGFVPKSRFTILDHGKVGAKVAVGYRQDDSHIIEEHSLSGDLAVVYDDIVKLAQQTSRRL